MIKAKGWFALEPKSGAARRPLLHQYFRLGLNQAEFLNNPLASGSLQETRSLYIHRQKKGNPPRPPQGEYQGISYLLLDNLMYMSIAIS
jgi:hypothetical protein